MGPTSIYRAPVVVKAGVTPDEAPGLTGVAPGQEGPPDDPGGHHVATLALPRAPPGAPRNARIEQKAPEHLGMKAHRPASTATPGSPGVTPDGSDTGGTPDGCYSGPDKTPACLTGAGQSGRRLPPCRGCVHIS